MHKLDRYIMKSVFSAGFLVLFVVLTLDVLFSTIEEMGDIRHNYQFVEVLIYVFCTVPRRLYEYLPMAAFMGCLIGLGALASSSELVVIRAAGVSLARIVWSTMKPAIVFMLIGLGVGEYVAPPAEAYAQSMREIARSRDGVITDRKGFWHRDGNIFMRFSALEPGGVLHDVSQFHLDGDFWLDRSTHARRAVHHEGYWMLEDVSETRITREATEKAVYPSVRWDTQLTPDVLSVLVMAADDLSLADLVVYSRYLAAQGINYDAYRQAFWKKVLQPLGTVVLVLVAISFVFGPLRTVSMGTRVFTGILVGLGFKYFQDILGPSSAVFGFHPSLATIIPIALCFLVGMVLLRRAG